MIAAEFIAPDPAAIGIAPDRLQALNDYVRGHVEDSEESRETDLPSAQIAIGRHGKIAGVATYGTAVQGGEDKPATDETVYCIYSATKAIVGAASWALIEDGKLDIDEHVADIVPAFKTHGKEIVTVRQLLTHTGGFPYAPMHPKLWEDRDLRNERMEYWRLTWEPDSRFEYHATAAHWALAEIITQRTGLDFRDYVRERLLEPMGVPELFVGLPDEEHHRAADVVYVHPPTVPEGGTTEVTPETILHFNLPSQRRAGTPGGGAFASAGELALFYQRLVSLQDSGAHAPLKPATIELGATVYTKDHHVNDNGLPVNRGLTVVVAGDHPVERGFAPTASPRAFGHAGAGGQIAWGDPETGLSIGFVTNGFVDADEQTARTREINRLAGECLLD